MKTTVLTLEAHDDLISIRDKLAWAKSPRILLVWPKRRRRNVEAPLYLSRLDLTLLVRQACQLGAQLALVTANPQVRAYAAEAGVAVFDSADDAQDATWRRTRRRSLRRVRRMRPEPLQVPAAAGSEPSARQVPPDWRARRKQFLPAAQPAWMKSKIIRLVFFTAGVLAVLAVALLFLPGAKVRLNLVQQEQNVRLGIWASPDVPQALVTGALPARVETVTVEGQQQAVSSGSVLIPESYASGQVLFTNLTEAVVQLPAGTVLRTLDLPAQRFELLGAVQLSPGVGKVAQGTVRALLPGPEANVATSTIQSVEGSLGGLVGVDNPQRLGGGTERKVPAPTDADYIQVRQELVEVLRQSALQELSTRGDVVILESLEIAKIELEQRVPLQGAAADTLLLTMRVEFSAWVVQRSDLERVGAMALEATMPEGFHPARAIPEIRLESDFSIQGERAGAVLSANWMIEPAFSASEVARAISGLSPQAAQERLQTMFKLLNSPTIEMNPPWWPALPLLPASIQVVREQP